MSVVFAGFVGSSEGFGASGDKELDGAGTDVECRRTLGGVEGSDASAGAGADVDEASAFAEGGGYEIDGAGDLGKSTRHGESDRGIFGVDEGSDLEGGLAIEIGGVGVRLLGAQAAEILLILFFLFFLVFQQLSLSGRLVLSFNDCIVEFWAHLLDGLIRAVGPGAVR